MPRHPRPKQAAYADNLSGNSLGLAVYHPIPLRPDIHVGRVGDIAFFGCDGGYEWINNAFLSPVPFPSLSYLIL
jgi:hypothetical protein